MAATAMIAYYNAAAEYEAIGDWSEAKEFYEVSQHIAKQIHDHAMTVKTTKALSLANMKVRSRVQRVCQQSRNRSPMMTTGEDSFRSIMPGEDRSPQRSLRSLLKIIDKQRLNTKPTSSKEPLFKRKIGQRS